VSHTQTHALSRCLISPDLPLPFSRTPTHLHTKLSHKPTHTRTLPLSRTHSTLFPPYTPKHSHRHTHTHPSYLSDIRSRNTHIQTHTHTHTHSHTHSHHTHTLTTTLSPTHNTRTGKEQMVEGRHEVVSLNEFLIVEIRYREVRK